MKKLAFCLFIAGLLVGYSADAGASTDTSIRFGIDAEALGRAEKRGLDFSYGTIWVGGWTQKYGWGDVEHKLRLAKKHGATPVVNWWYWGDDISPSCVANGCRDRYHGVEKNAATWYRMSEELSRLVHKTMGDAEAYVVLETEFNKAGMETSEAFDGQLAEAAAIFRRRGNVKIVVGFGNWGRQHWARFDRAIAAADFIGTQLLQSSLRDKSTYARAVTTLLDSARFVQKQFGKPSLVTDLGMSSYPSSSYEAQQAAFTRELRSRIPEFEAAGVRGILFRMISDDPNFDTANYHGVAERHWGFLRADGSEKPAYADFAATVRAAGAER